MDILSQVFQLRQAFESFDHQLYGEVLTSIAKKWRITRQNCGKTPLEKLKEMHDELKNLNVVNFTVLSKYLPDRCRV